VNSLFSGPTSHGKRVHLGRPGGGGGDSAWGGWVRTWRGARVAESGGLENRCPGNWTVGSNPTLSAIVSRHAWKNRKGAGPCAKGTFEPRQVRKEATVRRPSFVPQDHLAPVFRRRSEEHTSELQSP